MLVGVSGQMPIWPTSGSTVSGHAGVSADFRQKIAMPWKAPTEVGAGSCPARLTQVAVLPHGELSTKSTEGENFPFFHAVVSSEHLPAKPDRHQAVRLKGL